MGRFSFHKKANFKRWFNRKTIYVALAVCIVAIGGVAVVTLISVFSPATGELSAPQSSDQGAGRVVSNIPDDRTTRPPTSPPTTSPTTLPTTPPTTAKPTPLFVLPLSNQVSKAFSGDVLVFSNTLQLWRTHNGTDFAGKTGQTVKAISDGKVITVKQDDALWGGVIEIQHSDGMISRYCGVRVDKLKAGDTVTVGQAIGTLSAIPCEAADGEHLHLEVLVKGQYVDPVATINLPVKNASGE